MKRSTKRILIILVSIMMIMTYMIPGSVFADSPEDAGVTSDNESQEAGTADIVPEGENTNDVIDPGSEDQQLTEEPAAGEPDSEVPDSKDAQAYEESNTETKEASEADSADTSKDELTEASDEAPSDTEDAEEAPIKASKSRDTSGGMKILAFTSDIHNSSSNVAADRLDGWFDEIVGEYGQVDYMGFGGDMGAASANESQFWDYTSAVKRVVDYHGIHGFYTTGNHEYYNGKFKTTGNAVKDIFTIGEEDPYTSNSNYRVYALGTTIDWGINTGDEYEQAQIDKLSAYLAEQDGSVPIIVLTHFPLHYFRGNMGTRQTTRAIDVINELNAASARGLTIVYLWGHNHTMSDTFYDEIYGPGDTIPYTSSNSTEIQFYYAAAGCMSDTEYTGSGSSSVKGKGLVIQVRDDGSFDESDLGFAYHNATGANVTENKDEFPVFMEEVEATGMSLDQETLELTVGETGKLTLSFIPSNATNKSVTWTSSDESVATVSSSGTVTGMKAGTAEITVTHEDGGFTDTCTVTVKKAPGQGVTPESGHKYVILASDRYALTSEGEEVGYQNGSGDQIFYYHGLAGEEYTIGDDVAPDHLLWTFTESEDGTGYYIQDQNGRYLNATYEANDEGGSTGILKLDETQDIWIISGTASGSSANANILKSTNASLSADSDKYLTHGNGDNGGDNTNIFTVRSEDHATSTVFYEYNDDGTYVPDPDEPTPVDPPAGKTVDIAPGTDVPEVSVNIDVGDTLIINVKNNSSSSGYDFTAALDGSGVAQIEGSDTVNIAAGATGQFTIKGLAEGTAAINIQNDNTHSQRKGIVHLTVGDGGDTPEDPPGPTEGTDYILTDKLEAGNTYVIASSNEAGKTHILGHNGDTAATYSSDIISKNGILTITTDKADVAFEAEAITNGVSLANGGYYMTVEGGGDLTFSTSTSTKYWAYENNKLSSNSSNARYLTFSSNEFKGYYSSSNPNPSDIFLFEKVDSAPGEDPVEGVELNKNELALTEGETETLKATVLPSTAEDKTVTWSSSDETVASVDETGRVTAVGEGTAVITVTTNSGGKTDVCTVTVAAAPEPTKYILTDKLEAGKDYLIVNVADIGSESSRALKNPGGTSQGASPGKASVMVLDGNIIETSDTDIVWSAEANSADENGEGVYLVNGGDYLEVYHQKPAVFDHAEQSSRYWTYSDSQLTHIGGSNPYFLTYSNGEFSSSSSSATMYLFEKVEEGAHIHTWDEGTVTAEPTCTEQGAKTFTCTECGETKEAIISALGHDMTKTEAKDPTCAEDGNNEFWTCGRCHKFFSDSDGKTEIEVGSWIVDRTGHTPGTPVYEKAKTASCTEAGSYDTVVYCSVCNEELSRVTTTVPALGHDWGEWEVTIPATEIAEGIRTRTCSRCDETQTEAIPTLPHEHKLTAVPSKAATCTEPGNTAYWVCDQGDFACGMYFSDEEGKNEIEADSWIIPPKGHTAAELVHENVTEPTCTDAGSHDEVVYCSACGTELSRVKAVDDALGHAWGEWEVTEPATELKEGLEERTCSRCGEIESRVINKLIHKHVLIKVDEIAPTCTEDGNLEYWVCNGGINPCHKFFGDSEGNNELNAEDIVIPATGHDWECKGFTWEEAENGYTAAANFVCKNDPSHKETKGAEVTHVTVDASCEADGETVYTAHVVLDGKEYSDTKREVIPKTGHRWEFTDFTWTGSDKTGYTAAQANYICANDETHKKTVNAALSSSTTLPTCEKFGSTVYTVTVNEESSPDGSEHTDSITVVIPATGHDFELKEWKWTGRTKAVATFVCRHDRYHNKDIEAEIVSEKTREETCEADGEIKHTATVAFENETYVNIITDAVPATGHAWGGTAYRWADDLSSVTATRICTHNAAHFETETVLTTGEVTKPAACETNGETTYKASFANPAFETQYRTAADIRATGHDWMFLGFTWEQIRGEGYKAVANYKCMHDSDHTATMEADVISTTVNPTCTQEGKTAYAAVISKESSLDGVKHTATKEVKLDPIGHSYVFDGWTWASDYSYADAKFHCEVCDNKNTVKVTSSLKTTAAQVGKPGSKVYTVTLNADKSPDSANHTSKQTIEIPALPHPAPKINISNTGTDGNYAQRSFKITFSGTGAVKYVVAYRERGGKWIKRTTTNNSYTISGLKAYRLYEIKVAGINKDGKQGAYSGVSYRYMAKVIYKVSSPKKGTIKVTANKVSGLTGYQIKYSTSKDMSNAKYVEVNTTKNLSKTIKVSSKKTYYVQVRPKVKKGGNVYKGIIEAKKSVKAK